MSEQELNIVIKGCINGQRKEQHLLYQYLAPLLFKVCLRYASNNELAKDYLQESLIKIFHKIVDFRNDGPLAAWARRIAVNTIIDNIRKEGNVIKTISIEEIKDKDHLSIQNDGSRQLDYSDIVTLVNRLPEAKKVVFNLYAIEGYTHKEIAEYLQITEGTSKSQLHKARELLARMHADINKKRMLNEDLA